jgi:hypothetical protein
MPSTASSWATGGSSVPAVGFFGAVGQSGLNTGTKVCRGGDCSATSFQNGTGVTQESDGSLNGVSVRVGVNGESGDELLQTLPARFGGEGGVSNVGEIEEAGGELMQQGSDTVHYVINGLTPDELETLFSSL